MSWLTSWRHWRMQRRARRITYDHALTRVRRGAAYLDDVDSGWHRRIDPATLELRSGDCCVLGQLHGDFRRGLARAHLIDLSSAPRANLAPWTYGFQCEPGLAETVAEQDYAYLNLAWQAAIAARDRAETASTTSDPSEAAAPALATVG